MRSQGDHSGHRFARICDGANYTYFFSFFATITRKLQLVDGLATNYA